MHDDAGLDPGTCLSVAREHVVRGEDLVARQRALLDELEHNGFPSAAAAQLLATMESTLRLFREHLAMEEQAAAAQDPLKGPPPYLRRWRARD